MTDEVKPPRRPRSTPADKSGTAGSTRKSKPASAKPKSAKPKSPESVPSKTTSPKPASSRAATGKSGSGKAGAVTSRAGKAAAASATAPAERAGPRGFGGWLWLLAIGQLLVTARMIDTLLKLAATIGTELWQDHPGLVVADLALYGAALVLQFGVIVAMVLGRRLFVPLFIASIAAYFLIGRIEPLLAIIFLGMDPAGLVARPALVSMLIELAVGLVWGAYVLRSRRVRNTFVR